MFERLKKVFGQGAPQASGQAPPTDAVSEWAGTQGFTFTGHGADKGFSLTGKVSNKPWRLERGRSSRDYIQGEELRARAELGINEEAAVLIMNRSLKESLEKQAYQIYTDHLRTSADPSLPEEMRWLSIYTEVGWDSLPGEFWARYSVLADDRQHALAWIDQNLAELLLSWPEPGPDEQAPFIMMLLRGKAYLRMQYTPANVATLEHAAVIYTSACELALAGLSTDIAL
ncbi:hypothetical protein [Polaromonas sp.]|uniref:hypothetical protein n=1 Tax=Polaromonas sp. TaxID=1869339 RepID=UPI002FC59C55